MPSLKPTPPLQYTIFFDGRIVRGAAQELLEIIRDHASQRSTEAARMSTERYAVAIIEDAKYFLPAKLLDYVNEETYDSEFDRALRYLGEMSASGVRVLKVRARSA